jgi:FAD:protein FMN transferase
MGTLEKKIDVLSKTLGMQSRTGKRFIKLLIEAMIDELSNGGVVELEKLGTIYVAPGPNGTSESAGDREPAVKRIAHFLPSPSLERRLNKRAASGTREFVAEKGLMHTTFQLKIVHEDEALVRNVMDEAFELFRRHESAYNFYDPRSELSLLNSQPGVDVPLSPEFHDILKTCCMVGQKSDGAYDITIGPVVRLWNMGSKHPKVPADEEIRTLLPKVNFRSIAFRNGAVSISPGISVDLSGAIKGFSADEGQKLLRKRGICNAMVNAGRNIYVLGKNGEGTSWKIGVAHPREPDTLIALLHLEDEAVATSGDYERYFFEGGKRYHHLLDPRTGYPSNGCVGVTVVSKSAALTDILSTAAFILGPERGKILLAELDCEGIFITRQGIEVTPGLLKKLEFLCNPQDVIKSISLGP